MCPFCFVAVGLVVAGTVSTGGLAALAVRVSRKNRAGEVLPNADERKDQNVDEHDGEPENSVAR
jgi:hypothetical protein